MAGQVQAPAAAHRAARAGDHRLACSAVHGIPGAHKFLRLSCGSVQAASASTGRELDRLGAMACLCGRNNRFLIKNSAVSLGRATDVTQVGGLAVHASLQMRCRLFSVPRDLWIQCNTLKAAVPSATHPTCRWTLTCLLRATHARCPANRLTCPCVRTAGSS